MGQAGNEGGEIGLSYDITSRLKDLADTIEEIAFVSDMENKGPMYANMHIRSGIVKISKESANSLRQGAKDIRELIERVTTK
jgi:hypothetical protein